MKLGIGKGSAKAKFVAEQKINSYSVYLLVHVLVTNPTKRLRDVRLTDSARELLASGKPEEFRRRCGDEFLVGITTGGEFIGLIEIESESEARKREITASARASGLTWKAGADFAQAISKITERRTTRVVVFRKGAQTSIPFQHEDMLEHAKNFPNSVVGEHAFPYSASFQSYDVLDLPQNVNLMDVKTQKEVIERLAAQNLAYQTRIANIEYILDHPEQFEPFDRSALSVRVNDFSEALNRIRESVSKCFNDVRACKLPTDLPGLGVLPQRKGGTGEPVKMKDGSLFKGSYDRVYLMERGERRWIPDPQTFNCLELDWNAVQTITDADLNSIPPGLDLPSRAEGPLLKGNDPAVFKMEGCQRRFIPSAEIFDALGPEWDAIQTISDRDLDAIQRGPDLS